MSEDNSSGKRYNTRTRNKKQKNVVPNASFYVGYCEDYETPAMIMRKFEELEKLKSQKKEAEKAKEREKEKEKESDETDNNNNNNIKSSKAEISDSDSEDNEEKDNKNNVNEGLTDAELSELFQNTSLFSVRSVMNGNEILHDKPIISKDGFIIGYEDNVLNCDLAEAADYDIFEDFAENDAFFATDDENFNGFDSDFYEDVINQNKKRIKGSGSGITRRGHGTSGTDGSKSEKKGYYQGRVGMDTNALDYTFGGSRGRDGTSCKEQMAEKVPCNEINYVKVPPHPLPRSWAHKIKKFDGKRCLIDNNMELAKQKYVAFNYHKHENLINLKASDLNNEKYIAVLIDCPFDLSDSFVSPKKGLVSIEQYRQLPIGDLVDNGFLFIWTPSELIYEVCTIAEEWGFTYADHSCWLKKLPNNRLVQQKGQFLRQSKANLLLFRKIKEPIDIKKYFSEKTGHTMIDFDAKNYAGKIDLRHQRSSDVHFDFIKYHKNYKKFELKPNQYAFELIEILIPQTTRHLEDALNKKSTKEEISNLKSNMLYLWAPENEVRRGWTMVVDNKHCQFLKELEKSE